jgi:hypothetical protein
VTRRVEEGDLAAVVLDLVRADVLRDPAGLRLDDATSADRVEQRRLAVVDVAHDRHDRRAWTRSLGVLELLRLSSSSAACRIVSSRSGASSAAISSTSSSDSDCVIVTPSRGPS